MTTDVFSVPVFLIVFRETLETVIIVSVLLAYLKQTLHGPNGNARVYKLLRRQVWIGVAAGFFLCMVVAGAIIGVFYTVRLNSWEANENYYEGAFCLLASVIITIMGAALLRIGKMQDKWRLKLARAVETPRGTHTRHSWARFAEKYAMFVLPFITVLREGIEAVVFTAGVSFTAPASAVPLPVVVGLFVGILIGYIIYKYAPSSFRPAPDLGPWNRLLIDRPEVHRRIGCICSSSPQPVCCISSLPASSPEASGTWRRRSGMMSSAATPQRPEPERARTILTRVSGTSTAVSHPAPMPAVGASSMPSLAGPTRPRTDPSFPTTSTGSSSSWASSSCDSTKPRVAGPSPRPRLDSHSLLRARAARVSSRPRPPRGRLRRPSTPKSSGDDIWLGYPRTASDDRLFVYSRPSSGCIEEGHRKPGVCLVCRSSLLGSLR